MLKAFWVLKTPFSSVNVHSNVLHGLTQLQDERGTRRLLIQHEKGDGGGLLLRWDGLASDVLEHRADA